VGSLKLCRMCLLFRLLLDLENGDSTFLRNIGKLQTTRCHIPEDSRPTHRRQIRLGSYKRGGGMHLVGGSRGYRRIQLSEMRKLRQLSIRTAVNQFESRPRYFPNAVAKHSLCKRIESTVPPAISENKVASHSYRWTQTCETTVTIQQDLSETQYSHTYDL
jgi:hypothetical protein